MTQPRSDTPTRTPPLELLLGYGPALVILAASALALAGVPWALTLGCLWASAILIFLAGVVRGLSFFTEGGPRASQVAVMMVRFVCGFAALVLPAILATPVLAVGYLSSLLYDPFAARNGAAPRYFAQWRCSALLRAVAPAADGHRFAGRGAAVRRGDLTLAADHRPSDSHRLDVKNAR